MQGISAPKEGDAKKKEATKVSITARCCLKAKDAGKACDHPCCVAAAKEGKPCPKCSPAAPKEKKSEKKKEVSKKEPELPGCCAKAKANGKECGHPCCVAAAKEGKLCAKCGK